MNVCSCNNRIATFIGMCCFRRLDSVDIPGLVCLYISETLSLPAQTMSHTSQHAAKGGQEEGYFVQIIKRPDSICKEGFYLQVIEEPA